MKASVKLLRKFVNLEGISTQEIVDKLTFAGLEVEDVYPVAQATNLVIGQIVECVEHPSSDHLHILQVDMGEKYGVNQIVCGAPNARVGLKVIVARVGAELKAHNITIQKGVIRGVESNGMCCALTELGVNKMFLNQNQIDGIEELPEDAIVGNENVLEYLGLDDEVIDINVLANRSDCLSVFSLAKEIGALLNREVKVLDEVKFNELSTDIKVKSSTKSCSQFSIKLVEGCKTKPSPKWLSAYLMAHGIRSINNIVDIGNYIMILTGQPLHMYDMDKLTSNEFDVRDDYECEFVALDDKTYNVTNGDIVITNGGHIGCLGGVMGAKECAVDDTTTRIAIEAAYFNGANVRRTTIKTGLSSDSSARFIKGINPHQDQYVLNLTAQLLVELADANAVYETVRYLEKELVIEPIKCKYSYINKRLGTAFTASEMDEVFTSLGIKITHVDDDNFEALPPAHRIDLKCNADLSEEIFRFIGLSTIKPTLPVMVTTVGGYSFEQLKKKRIREHLINNGLSEILTYTLISPTQNEKVFCLNDHEAVQVMNPMTVEHSIVRRGLIASVLEVLNYNLSRQNKDIALFEVSDVTTQKDRYQELAIVLNGEKSIRGALNKKAYDFYDIYGYFDSIMQILGIDEKRYKVVKLDNEPFFHPGRSVAIYLGKERVGVIGELHPKASKDYGRTYILDINLSKFIEMKTSQVKMQQISRYPAVDRDYALIVKKDVLAQDIIRACKKESRGIVSNVQIFDVYEGEFLPEGMKSLAIKIRYSSLECTLKDDQIKPVENAILNALNKNFGAYLRS